MDNELKTPEEAKDPKKKGKAKKSHGKAQGGFKISESFTLDEISQSGTRKRKWNICRWLRGLK